MNKTILSLVVLAVFFLVSGCKKDKLPTTAELNITCKPLKGQTLSMKDLKAELHTTATYENLKYHVTLQGTDSLSTGKIGNITPARYFLVVWKDNDDSKTFTKNDFFGFYPNALNLKAGDNKKLTIEMYIIQQ